MHGDEVLTCSSTDERHYDAQNHQELVSSIAVHMPGTHGDGQTAIDLCAGTVSDAIIWVDGTTRILYAIVHVR
jgi:predicted small metal-binding protein